MLAMMMMQMTVSVSPVVPKRPISLGYLSSDTVIKT